MTLLDSRPAEPPPAPLEPAPDAPSTQQALDRAPSRSFPPAGPDSPAPTDEPTPSGDAAREPKQAGSRMKVEAHGENAAGSNSPDQAVKKLTTPNVPSLLDPALSFAADILDDIERVKIANANRLRQMTRSVEDSDGELRGFGFDESHPDVARLAAMVETLGKVEHDAVLGLQRQLRRHPLHAWMKAQKGIGEKQGARLLAAIGDPYIRPEWVKADGTVVPEGPRTVSALWAYCGLHVLPAGHTSGDDQGPTAGRTQLPGGQGIPDAHPLRAAGNQPSNTGHDSNDTQDAVAGVAAKRRKGQRANWSNNAKMRAYLIAESCIKQLSPDCRDGHTSPDSHLQGAVPAQDPQDRDGRLTGDAQRPTAARSCACSPYRVVYDNRRAHTAGTRPDWTDGHSHNDALRVASKEILKDLWRAAREWHLANGATA